MSVQVITGNNTNNVANVNDNYQLCVSTETDVDNNPKYIGVVKVFSENVTGTYMSSNRLDSMETDDDYRIRTSQDVILDDELFNYTAQSTGKHTIVAAAVTLAPSWTTNGYNTNPTSIVATTTGATLQTYAMFGIIGSATLSLDAEISFTNLPVSNTIIDFGFFSGASSNPFAPTDGAYFRLNSNGLEGVINYGGNEVSTGTFPLSNGAGRWIYDINKKYQFILYVTITKVSFWIDGELIGSIPTPHGQGAPYLSATLPFRIRHAIVGGAASSALNCILTRYNIRMGGAFGSQDLLEMTSRIYGSYQGLSGGTIGSLQFGTVTTGSIVPPTPAAITNTTAALGAGLGGMFYETTSIAAGTDGVLSSYQVPAGTTLIQGRRLILFGVGIQSFVQTGTIGGPWVAKFYIAYGHTAVSLATAVSGSTRAPIRVPIPIVQTVTINQAVSTRVSQNIGYYKFPQPIYVNPGQFVQLVTTKVGVTGGTGAVAHSIVFDYSWE